MSIDVLAGIVGMVAGIVGMVATIVLVVDETIGHCTNHIS
jgi:hypothetical protein